MSSKLYIGNLNYAVTEDELSSFLSESAPVTECRVIEGKGFAFVSFQDEDSANAVKEKLNGQDFMGRPLKIDNARENNNRGGGDRRRSFSGGGSRQKRY